MSFRDLLEDSVKGAAAEPRVLAAGECQTAAGRKCTLCLASTLSYSQELAIKNHALQRFWKGGVPLEGLVPSPRGREYRTVTKRRVRNGRLGLIDPTESGPLRPLEVLHCAIEPTEHQHIYQTVQRSLARHRALAHALVWVVIKGNYRESWVILSVNRASPDVMKDARQVSKAIGTLAAGVFLYEDTSDGRFYLGAASPSHLHKLYGSDEVFQRFLGLPYLFSPLAFTQTNPSIVDSMVTVAGEMLELQPQDRLADLYCGYGLFGLALAPQVESVVGTEMSRASIAAAKANAARQKATHKVRFIQADITPEAVRRHLSDTTVVILDPPLQGTPPGVIEALHGVRRALHIFCNIDGISDELARWRRIQYEPIRAVPFDMFPGTASIETVVLLGRRGAGR